MFDIQKDSLKGEVWKQLKGYEWKYSISNFGRIITINGRRGGVILSKLTQGKFYLVINLIKFDNYGIKNSKVKPVHILVAESFIQNPLKLPEVNHKDGVKTNNNESNLEWVTHLENMQHAVRTRLLDVKGEKHFAHKLTELQVLECRKRYLAGGVYHKDLANEFGITRRNMGDVINGVTWAWLK